MAGPTGADGHDTPRDHVEHDPILDREHDKGIRGQRLGDQLGDITNAAEPRILRANEVRCRLQVEYGCVRDGGLVELLYFGGQSPLAECDNQTGSMPILTDPVDKTHRDADEQVDLPKHALPVFERELMLPAGLFEQTFRVVKLVIGVEALLHFPGFERSWRNDVFGVLELYYPFLVGIVSQKVRHCVRDEQCVSFRAEGVVYSVSWRHVESCISAVRCCGPRTVQ